MRKLRFTVDQIRTFAVVAETEHISRSAERLFLTQGAVTQQVHQLERALGVQLLERVGRRVRLTDAGRAVALASAGALRGLEAVEDVARSFSDIEAGTLKIGASPTSASHFLPRLLSQFTARYPGVEIEVTASNSPTVAARLVSGAIDCGLVEGDISHPQLEEMRLWENELVVVCAARHPLALVPEPRPEDLAEHRFLGREPGSAVEAIAAGMLGEAYRRSSHLVFGHPEAIRAAAREGLGYAVLPAVTVADEVAAGALVRLPFPPAQGWIRALRRRSYLVPTVEAFWRLLREQVETSETLMVS